ncbi:hypothetical protein EHS25_004689 [Saitozyma podzolica]|uniref:Uncharacterized protein n=1 Tax=Saitozyma podzolica TaxID=1890683 RepID=A0A427YUR1_9TREE|nr:hypothetical protein EHS25_004689 [Saitozyma podzolica]
MSGTSGTIATATQTLPNPTTSARYPTTIYLILTGVRTEWHESDAGQTLTIPEFTLRLDYDSRNSTGTVGAGGHLLTPYPHPNCYRVGHLPGPSELEVAQVMGRQLLMEARKMKWTDAELFELSEAAASAEMGSTGNVDGGGSSTVTASTTAPGTASATAPGTATGRNGVGVGLGVGAWGSGRGVLMCGGRSLTTLATALRGQRFQALFDRSWEMTRRIMAVNGHRDVSGDGIDVALYTCKEYEEGWSRRRGAGGA